MRRSVGQLLGQVTAEPAADPRTDRALMAQVGAALFAAGASLTLLYLLAIPHPPGTNELGLAAQITASYATAAVVLVAYKHATWWTYQLFSAWATVLVTAGIYFAGENVAVSALFLVWVNQFSFYFYNRIQAAMQLVFVGLCYWTVLFIQQLPAGALLTRWVVVMGTLVVVGTLVGALRGRVQLLVARLAEAARTDPLTGLLNRRGFEDEFSLELERMRRTGRSLGLLICDLDHFKQVNDRLGHRVGDRTLERLSEVLTDTTRRIDSAVRMGGEEFALILPETDERGAYVLAERLRGEVKRSFEDGPVPLTISFGIASFPKHGETAEELLGAADQALYTAKALGRDRTVVHGAGTAMTAAAAAGAGDQREEYQASVLRLAETLGIRDAQAARRCERVGAYAEMTARALGLADEVVEGLSLASVLHGLEGAGPPDSVVRKPGPRSEQGSHAISRPPQVDAGAPDGASLGDARGRELADEGHPDGRGDSRGPARGDVPLEEQILAVAGAYEAMTGGCAHQPAVSHEEAGERLRRGCAEHFDRQVVEALLRSVERRRRAEAPRA